MSKPNNLLTFVSKVSATSAAGKTGMDAWRQYLQADVGAPSGSLHDLEVRWLQKHGGTGSTIEDLWHSYLNGKAIPAGNLGNRKEQFFRTASAA
jgi:hypothetical protein